VSGRLAGMRQEIVQHLAQIFSITGDRGRRTQE
jgi:hypothetical protein